MSFHLVLVAISLLAILFTLVNGQDYLTYCTLSLDYGPTGLTTTNIATNTSAAVLTIIQTLTFISCSGQPATISPWAYIGSPNSIVEGDAIVISAGPYATTSQSLVVTAIYPTVTLETILPSVVVWNEPDIIVSIGTNVNPGLPETASFTLVIDKGNDATVTVTAPATTTPTPTTLSQNGNSPVVITAFTPTSSSVSSGTAVSVVTVASQSSGSGLSSGAIAGIVVGSVVGVALLVIIAFLLWKRRPTAHEGATIAASTSRFHDGNDHAVIAEEKGFPEPQFQTEEEPPSGRLQYPDLEDTGASGNLEGDRH